MAEWDILKDLLVDDLFRVISSNGGRHSATLKETSEGAKTDKIVICDVSSDAVLLKIDHYEQPVTLFRGDKGERRRCDYLLFTKYKGNNVLLFIEMKSKNFSRSGVEQQFKSAECIMDYCSAAISRFHGKHNFLDQFNKRFVCFFYKRMRMRGTRPKAPYQNSYTPYKKNNTPEKMLKYPCSETPPPISLRSLVYANRLT